jgi:Domain of unknown function (DUF4390)
MAWRYLWPAALLITSSAAAAQSQTDSQSPETIEVRQESAAEPRITDVRISFEKPQIRLSFKLLGAFDDSLRKRLDSGLPTSFTFQFELLRMRKSWFDKSVESGSLQVGAMYNAVTREYLINFKHDGNLIESRVVKDLTDLEAAMTAHDGFPVFPTEGLSPETRMRVRVRAELGTKTVFFFIPSTVHTDWAETRKFRLDEEIE